jgi:hypothetical protein
MEISMKSRPSIGLTTLAMALTIISSILSAGAGGKEPAVNPTGTWKVTYTHDGKTETYQPTLKLKLAGDKLTGTLSRRHNQQDIEMVLQDMKLKASEIFFMVSVPPVSGNGPNYTRKFHGKITGDMIKGTEEDEWMGQLHSLDWEAKRVKQ